MEELGIEVDGLPTAHEDMVEKLGAKGDGLPMLPDDLIIDILACMPVRSVVRFRCVSKSWYSLIKEPDFIDKHALERKKNGKRVLMLRCYFQTHCNELSFHDLDSVELSAAEQPNLSIPQWNSSFGSSRILGKNYILGPCKGLVIIMDCDIFDRIRCHTFRCVEQLFYAIQLCENSNFFHLAILNSCAIGRRKYVDEDLAILVAMNSKLCW